MSSLRDVVPELEMSVDGNVVSIDLVCSDAYAAQVFHDDLLERARSSPNGVCLTLRFVAPKCSGEKG